MKGIKQAEDDRNPVVVVDRESGDGWSDAGKERQWDGCKTATETKIPLDEVWNPGWRWLPIERKDAGLDWGNSSPVLLHIRVEGSERKKNGWIGRRIMNRDQKEYGREGEGELARCERVRGEMKRGREEEKDKKRDGEQGGRRRRRRRRAGQAVTILPYHETTKFDRLLSFNQVHWIRKHALLDLVDSKTDADSSPSPRS